MKVTEPNSAKPTIKPTAQEIAKTRLANRLSGRIGSAATYSATMNPASAARDPAARAQRGRRGPGDRVAAEAGEEDQCGQRHGEERGAGDVDARPPPCARRPERPADDDQHDEPERQIDIEDPAPAQMLDEEPADQRAEHGREAEDAAKDALELATLARRYEIADDRHRGHDQSAAAEALQRAKDDELHHRAAEPA